MSQQKPVFVWPMISDKLYTIVLINLTNNYVNYMVINYDLDGDRNNDIIKYKAPQKTRNINRYVFMVFTQVQSLKVVNQIDRSMLNIEELKRKGYLTMIHELKFTVFPPRQTKLVNVSSKDKRTFIRVGDNKITNNGKWLYGDISWKDQMYIVKKKLGSGSYGSVYQIKFLRDPRQEFNTALGTVNGNIYALKVIEIPPEKNERSIRSEVEIWAHLSKTNACKSGYIACLYAAEIISIHGHKYALLYMEYVRGLTIKDYIEEYFSDVTVPVEVVMKIFGNLIDIFNYIHQAGINHSDIKDENLMIVEDPEKQFPAFTGIKAIDFGLSCLEPGRTDAKLLNVEKCNTEYKGSAIFSAPEAFVKGMPRVKFAGDVYSIGIVMYIVIEKKLPYHRNKYDRRKLSGYDLFRRLYNSGLVPNWTLSYPEQNITNMVVRAMDYNPRTRISLQELKLQWDNIVTMLELSL